MIITDAKLRTKKGYTIIYQYNPDYKGSDFVIGFKTGCRLDGKYPGLTHLIEHLFFNGYNKKIDNQIKKSFTKYFFDTNGHTSKYMTAFEGRTINENTEEVFDRVFKCLMNKKFTKEEIDRELDVIAFEKSRIKAAAGQETKNIKIEAQDKLGGSINFEDNITDEMLLSTFFRQMIQSTALDSYGLLGNIPYLKKHITPEIIKDYKNKYFNKENFIISIVTNKSLKEIEALCDKYIEKYVPSAKSKEYITSIESPLLYPPLSNLAIKRPNANKSNIEINVLFRERTVESVIPAFERAVDLIEHDWLNGYRQLLHEKFRTEKQLAYITQLMNVDVDVSKFKIFTFNTNNKKYNEIFKVLMKDVVGKIAREGIDRKTFEIIKKKNVESLNADKSLSPITPPGELVQQYLTGQYFLKYTDIENELKNMTYESFNSYIKQIYSMCNVSYTIDGDIDVNKCPNLIDLQHMAGIYKATDAKEREGLQRPIIEETNIDRDYLLEHEKVFWNEIEKYQKQIDETGEEIQND